jgi:hypothetical protein
MEWGRRRWDDPEAGLTTFGMVEVGGCGGGREVGDAVRGLVRMVEEEEAGPGRRPIAACV